MYEKIKRFYQKGIYTVEMVHQFYEKGVITLDEYTAIIEGNG